MLVDDGGVSRLTSWRCPNRLAHDDLDDPASFIDRIVGGDTSGIDAAITKLEDDLRDNPGSVDN